MSKIRIYELARELQINSHQIIKDAVSLGAKVTVPSNVLNEILADKIRNKYRATNAKKLAKNERRKARLVKWENTGITSRSANRSLSTIKVAHNGNNAVSSQDIILISKKATRIDEAKMCNKCLAFTKGIWRYAESNIGEVYICSRCKQSVYSRSFGSKDALDIAVQGGLFESNRRKH